MDEMPVPEEQRQLAARLEHIEGLLDRGRRVVGSTASGLRQEVGPAWSAEIRSELRWPVSAVVLVVVGLQLALPQTYRLADRWLVAAAELLLLATITALTPRRIENRSRIVRALSLTLLVVMSVANLDAMTRLVHRLLTGTEDADATALLLTGASIWLSNVVIFALWYWEFDRGGPAARHVAPRDSYPDFLFAQMAAPDLAPVGWRPTFLDYVYLSYTNGTAFSPTDTLPLALWAKVMMMAQSGVSLVTVALVIARAVNVLK